MLYEKMTISLLYIFSLILVVSSDNFLINNRHQHRKVLYHHHYNNASFFSSNSTRCMDTYKENNLSMILQENGNKWKIWPNIMTKYDRKHGNVIFGYKYVMDEIWANQNPENCDDAKFLIAEGFSPGGFASEIHILSVALAIAMELNRTLVMNPEGAISNQFRDNSWITHNDFCREMNTTSMECYYEPWSKCRIDHLMNGRTIADFKKPGSQIMFSDSQFVNKNEGTFFMTSPEKILLLQMRADVTPPIRFEDLYYCFRNRDNASVLYFWQAIASSFFVRPNSKVLSMMHSYRVKKNIDNHTKCISMYIRRGDKHIEMDIPPVESFFSTALVMTRNDMILPIKGHGVKTIVIGSEDPSVLEAGMRWGKMTGWNIIFTDVFDRREVAAYLNYTQQQELHVHGGLKHHPLEYYSMILNMDLLLRCNAFICTVKSNYCRLLDELRSTVANKAHMHWAEVGKDSCLSSSPPCFDSDIYDLYD